MVEEGREYGHLAEDSLVSHDGLARFVEQSSTTRGIDSVYHHHHHHHHQESPSTDQQDGLYSPFHQQPTLTNQSHFDSPPLPQSPPPPSVSYSSKSHSTSSKPARYTSPYLPDPPSFPRPIFTASPEPFSIHSTSSSSRRGSSNFPRSTIPSGRNCLSLDSYDVPTQSSPRFSQYAQPFFVRERPNFNSDESISKPPRSTLNSRHESIDPQAWVPTLPKDSGGGREDGFESFQRGIGFDDHRGRGTWTSSSSNRGNDQRGTLESREVERKMKRLEREFGLAVDEDGGEEGNVKTSSGNIRDRMKEVRRAMKKEEMDRVERSGVDSKGRLVVVGRKKRSGLRWFQGLGAIAIAGGSIGASLLTHPTEQPPPSGKLPLIVLYILPFLSLAITVFCFVIRPCLYSRRRDRRKSNAPTQVMDPRYSGIVPLLSLNPGEGGGPSNGRGGRGWCSCFGGRNRRRIPRGPQSMTGSGSGGGGIQPSINFIVDPSFFQRFERDRGGGGGGSEMRDIERRKRERRERKKRREKRKKQKERLRRFEEVQRRKRDDRRNQDGRRDDDEESENRYRPPSDDGEVLSDSSTHSLTSSISSSDDDEDYRANDEEFSSTNPRSFDSILSHVHLEEEWIIARRWLKRIGLVDVVHAIVWTGVAGWAIGWGEKCQPGTFQGYCDLYNTALAFSALLAISLYLSFTFDCLDLHRTNINPRHRQQRRLGRRL